MAGFASATRFALGSANNLALARRRSVFAPVISLAFPNFMFQLLRLLNQERGLFRSAPALALELLSSFGGMMISALAGWNFLPVPSNTHRSFNRSRRIHASNSRGLGASCPFSTLLNVVMAKPVPSASSSSVMPVSLRVALSRSRICSENNSCIIWIPNIWFP